MSWSEIIPLMVFALFSGAGIALSVATLYQGAIRQRKRRLK